MKALYRGPTIVLIPETDCEADTLAFQHAHALWKMAPCSLNGLPVPCFEFVIAEKDTAADGPLH